MCEDVVRSEEDVHYVEAGGPMRRCKTCMRRCKTCMYEDVVRSEEDVHA
jgi:DTW domain-containing protein YfiP